MRSIESVHAGRLPFSIGMHDNASEFMASIPTFALSPRSIEVELSGKMHFVGPDYHGYPQLKFTLLGFLDRRLVQGREFSQLIWQWLQSLRAILYTHSANGLRWWSCLQWHQAIYDLARQNRPTLDAYGILHYLHSWFQMSSGTFINTRYSFANSAPSCRSDGSLESEPSLLPGAAWVHCDRWASEKCQTCLLWHDILHWQKIGALRDALTNCGMADDTVIIFAADHGEMMGERGMWYKQHFFEWAAHVPLYFMPQVVGHHHA